jgi:hypothetical protein
MQVEGSKIPSDGRLTMSLIAPIALASPPKSVLLGSEQRGNGNVRYRIGRTVVEEGDIELRSLKGNIGKPLANGKVDVSANKEHIHLFGKSTNVDGTHFAFHIVAEDETNGQVVIDIAAMSNGVTVSPISGFALDAASAFDRSSIEIAISSLNLADDNVIVVKTPTGEKALVRLGKIDELVVETGVIERFSDSHTTRREGSELKIFSRDADQTQDPFGHFPIATLETNDVSWRFSRSIAPELLAPQIASGHVHAR